MEIETVIFKEYELRFENAISRLNYCLEQLNDAQMVWSYHKETNSIGTLIIHICGSFRQYTITAINNEMDKRDRNTEFITVEPDSVKEIKMLLHQLVIDYRLYLKKANSLDLLAIKHIQGNEVMLITALLKALLHLEEHIGQIVLLARLQLYGNYNTFWKD